MPKLEATKDWALLVTQVQAGDQLALDKLYHLVNSTCRFRLVRQVGPEDFEDRLNETFIGVLIALRKRQLREPTKLIPFIRKISDRQTYETFRVRAKTTAVSVDADTYNMEEWHHLFADLREFANPGQLQETSELTAMAGRAMQKLLPQQSEILTRFYFDYQTPDQIQLAMGLTENQFRLNKSRAKARLIVLVRREMNGHRFRMPVFSAEGNGC